MGPYHCLRGGQACQYAFLGIKLAFNGDHREVLEDWKNGSVVQLESHVKRVLLGMFLAASGSLAGSRGDPGRSQAGTPVADDLFPVAIDWVLGKQQEKRGVRRHCDIAENTRDLQPLVANIVRLQTALGSASGPKAINMLIGTHAPLRSVTIDKNKLKVAENFTYLVSSTNNKGQMDNELDCRLGKASAAFNQLGFETYYVEISQEKRLESLDASDSECVRKILSIRRQDFIPNTDI
ncbi:hypothetical protein Bbelb_032570 [Branchiostoma belcheri]|nr:hypothetical protein Bbelb_032570 [Branchiostoma belcheri]